MQPLKVFKTCRTFKKNDSKENKVVPPGIHERPTSKGHQ